MRLERTKDVLGGYSVSLTVWRLEITLWLNPKSWLTCWGRYADGFGLDVGPLEVHYLNPSKHKERTVKKRMTKKHLREELATAQQRIAELEQPMSERQLVTEACQWGSGTRTWCIWNILTAMRGPDGGGRFQGHLKSAFTTPIRDWARGRSLRTRSLKRVARALLQFTGAAAMRSNHYLYHINGAVSSLIALDLVPAKDTWYAQAILAATQSNFRPSALVEALEKHKDT